MEKKSFKKVKLAVAAMLLSICMAVVLPITSFAEDKQLIYGTDGTITRAEWVHDLVTAFDMTMSEGLKPDNYYADIAENQYYNDILTAMYFGVIDLEAGEKFEPDGKVTREFAAHTLSYCMGYELEKDTTYTMSDIGELLYPNDDQIAVNKGWFSLVSGKFMPGQYVSSTEVKAMLDDAAKVLEESKVDANHENQYTFESGVKEVPESSRFEFSGDNEITLYDTSAGIQTNDVFAVYSNGIAYTYKAVNVETKEDSLVITTEDVMYEDAVKYVDAEGVIEADLNDFVPEEGVSTEVEYAEEEMGAQSVSGTKKIGKVNISKSFGAGSVNCSISNIKVDYKINNSGYRFAVTGKINTKCSFSGKKDLTLTLGYINVAGVGKVQLQMIYSAKGSATVGFTTNAITGVEKKKGQAVRHLDNYTSPTWNFSAKAELKTACNLNFSVDIPMVANGRVYGETGIKSTPEVEVYTDGNTPKTCMDLPVYLYAEAGCSLNVFGESLVNETVPIYTASNSPIRICYHIEDGKCVKACSRPGSSSRVGKRGYYTSPDLTSGSGTYGGECFAAPYEEVKIFEYKVDSDGNATITKYSGNVSALTIPDDIDGYPVVAIGANAFSGNGYLQSVVVPDGVTSIGEGAFLACPKLSQVALSPKLKVLGGYAFGDCDSLTSITIPKSLEKTTTGLYPNYIRNFQWGVFIACDNLKNITFEEGTTKIANGLFANNDSIEKIVIPNTVTSIENDAFYKCSKLKEVSFSNSLISIGSNAFSSDKLIEKAEISDTVTTIKEGAFLGCSNLSEVKLSKRLKELGGYAFGDCDSLTSITIPKSLEKTTMGLYPNYIRNFQWGVFISCDNLKNITFEEGTTKIVNGLFANNDSIEKVVIPNTVTSIENDAFYKCSKLKQIDIPNSVTYIGTYDFAGCVSLEQIKLPKNIVSIEEGTFSDCTSLDTIQLPDNLQKIGPKVFTNCTSLKSIKIPSNVTKIDEKAFSNCDSLNDVTLPEGLTSIGREAFNLCISLEKICFPDSLQELGVYAFAECEKLSDITFGAGIKKVPNYCFYKDGEITAVILPQQMTAIGQYAFGNCVKLQEITINRKVNAIDATAFSYPSKMKIFGVKNTYAETFANENDITFEALNKPATAIKLSRTECEIPKGKKLLITASIEPTDSSDELLWSSEDEEIVKVVDGVITPVNVGTTYVQAQAGNVVQKCKVTVYQPVTRVNLNLTSKEMQIGSTLQLSASVYPDNAAKKDVIWKSDAEDIATVGEDGLVKALACGTANITVKTLDGGFERTCKITVVEAAAPTPTPTVTPTAEPQPTVTPTAEPQPTAVPTTEPQPTAVPTTVPTTEPQPTAVPTTEPQPTVVPTTKPQPTAVPTTKPQPTVVPTTKPQPTAVPTQKPQSTVKPQQPQAPNTSTGMSAGGNNSNNANTGANNSNSGSSNISGGSYGNAGNATTVSKITMWKITQKGKGKVKVIWKKVIGSSGYQVQYSLNKKMRAAKLKNCKAASLTIKKLKKKKAYYVRVRAYKRVNGRKVYGKWSGVKKVKIKK